MTVADPDDHDCPTCKFLQGDHSVETLLKVIDNLDYLLYKEEIHTANLTLILDLNSVKWEVRNASTDKA